MLMRKGPAGMSKDSREHKARARARDKTEMKFGKVSAGTPFTPTGVSANPRQTVAPATDRYADGAISFHFGGQWQLWKLPRIVFRGRSQLHL